MDPSQFIVIATRFAEGREGRIFRSARAESSISQADAQQKAEALALASATAAANGTPTVRITKQSEAYPYGVRSLVEPVLENVLVGGAHIARITENAYGASVINAYRVMFVDVDTEPSTERSPRTGEILPGQHTVTHDEALNALVDLVAARPELAFRVYTTAAGLRYLCTSKLFDPATPESEEILQILKSDKRYILLCRKQKCYRARLTPKPWRCYKEILLTPEQQKAATPKGFFAKLFSSAPGKKVLKNEDDFATCSYVQTIGNALTMPPEIAEIVRVHDQTCEVSSGKPLA